MALGESRFTDVIERALYNGINSGMSLGYALLLPQSAGLRSLRDSRDRHDPEGMIRNPWYDTTCCPPNLERTFASLPGYFYSHHGDGIYVHLYDNSEMNWRLDDGNGLKIKQVTNYPWDGDGKTHGQPGNARGVCLLHTHSRLVGKERRKGEWKAPLDGARPRRVFRDSPPLVGK